MVITDCKNICCLDNRILSTDFFGIFKLKNLEYIDIKWSLFVYFFNNLHKALRSFVSGAHTFIKLLIQIYIHWRNSFKKIRRQILVILFLILFKRWAKAILICLIHLNHFTLRNTANSLNILYMSFVFDDKKG